MKGLIPEPGWLPTREPLATCCRRVRSAKPGGGARGLGAARSGAGLDHRRAQDAQWRGAGALPEAMTEALAFSQHCLSAPDYEELLAAAHGRGRWPWGPVLAPRKKPDRRCASSIGRSGSPWWSMPTASICWAESRCACCWTQGFDSSPGEMSRLAGILTLEIQGKRRAVAAISPNARAVSGPEGRPPSLPRRMGGWP